MSTSPPTALDRARNKAYVRLLPMLFVCYIIAYVDRANVGFVKLTMQEDLPAFDDKVFGFGMGICFFVGYFLLEIPGTLMVEKWSARKWFCRIMVSWGLVAALTAFVNSRWPVVSGLIEFAGKTTGLDLNVSEYQFYTVRFLLGLAEAGFFPGVIVYLTHWFPSRDRARALAYFFIATPIAQFIGPPISGQLLRIGTGGRPELFGLEGWQVAFIFWGIPAVVLGVMVLFVLTDRPRQARWLEPDEREALEQELAREKAARHPSHHMTVLEALRHPKVLLLTLAYFCVVTGNYGVEFFLPSIIKNWYGLSPQDISLLVIIPPIGSLVGQLFIGWSSDRLQERRLHAALPIYFGATALACTLLSQGRLWLTVALFTLAMTGLKAYLPAFWSLPSLFLTEAAAAGSIGLINSVGNLGGGFGTYVLGWVRKATGSFQNGILFLAASMVVSATIILFLGLGRRAEAAEPDAEVDPLAEALHEPV
jgi:ACS family tartrate transporter-like MFS transporter